MQEAWGKKLIKSPVIASTSRTTQHQNSEDGSRGYGYRKGFFTASDLER
jgi:hypothetical protein